MSDLSDLAILRRVIDHVFLPRHTPDARDEVDAMADPHFAFLVVAFFEDHDGLVPRHISAAIRQFHRDRASPPSGPELIERFDSFSDDHAPIPTIVHLADHNAAVVVAPPDPVADEPDTLRVFGFDVLPTPGGGADAVVHKVIGESKVPLTTSLTNPRVAVAAATHCVTDLAWVDALISLRDDGPMADANPTASNKKGAISEGVRLPARPVFALDWLIPILGGVPLSDDEVVSVTKAVPGDLRHSSGAPWRRSPHWQVLKHMLHWLMESAADQGDPLSSSSSSTLFRSSTSTVSSPATTTYKDLMARFEAWLLVRWVGGHSRPRRIASDNDIGTGLEACRMVVCRLDDPRISDATREAVTADLAAVSAALEGAWEAAEAARKPPFLPSAVADLVSISAAEWEAATRHNFSEGATWIDKVFAWAERGASHVRSPSDDQAAPRPSLGAPPPDIAGMLDETIPALLALPVRPGTEAAVARCEIETCVHRFLFEAVAGASASGVALPSRAVRACLDLQERYGEACGSCQLADLSKVEPVQASPVVLTSFALFAMVDAAVVANYPTVGGHRLPTIKLAILHRLYIWRREDMVLLSLVEAYLGGRARRSLRPSFLSRESSGLPVTYVRNHLQHALESRTATVASCAAKKIAEVKASQADLAAKKTRLSAAWEQCTCGERNDYGQLIHVDCNVPSCEWEVSSHPKVALYERQLPDNSNMACVVVFEIDAPLDLLAWRESFCRLYRLCMPSRNHDSKPPTMYLWSDFWGEPIRSPDFGLASRKKPKASTHLPIQGVENAATSFVVPCGLDQVWVFDRYPLSDFSVWELPFRPVKLMQPYVALQQYADGTSHTENDVVCRQTKCPSEITLAEWRAFGTLRAGGRLQLSNVARAMETHSLTFEVPCSVNALVEAALWEVGPKAQIDADSLPLTLRDWNYDVAADHPAARRRLVFLAQRLLETVIDNWSAIGTLVSVAGVAMTVAQHEDDHEGDAADLLRTILDVSDRWRRAIGNEIGRLETDGATRTRPELEAATAGYWRRIAVLAAVAAMAAAASPEKVLSQDGALEQFLVALADVTDNTTEAAGSRFGRKLQSGTTQEDNLVARALAGGLDSEATIHALLAETMGGSGEVPGRCGVLSRFARLRGSPTASDDSEWRRAGPGSPTYYTAGGGGSTVTSVCVRTGLVLVNGSPMTRLPSSITNQMLFETAFGSRIFPVFREGSAYVSVVNGSDERVIRRFYDASSRKHKKLYVVEVRETTGGSGDDENTPSTSATTTTSVLVPSSYLSDQLPREATDGYIHWAEVVEGAGGGNDERGAAGRSYRLRFRLRQDLKVPHSNSFLGATADLRLGGLVTMPAPLGMPTLHLVSVKSRPFTTVAQVLSSTIASRNYMHVTLSAGGLPDVRISLPRLGLAFVVDSQRGVVGSRDYEGYVIDPCQDKPVLTDLAACLVLRRGGDGNGVAERMLLVPHVSESGMSRQADSRCMVLNGSSPLLVPAPVFAYPVDPILGCLRSSTRTDTLYLALLYGMTAGPMPFPLTGETGTATALALLRRCWSNAPYEAAEVAILNRIASLAPSRSVYPRGGYMEQVSWPTNVVRCYAAAAEAFPWVVATHLEAAYKLADLHGVEPVTLDDKEHFNVELAMRSMVRHRHATPPSTWLTAAEEIAAFGGARFPFGITRQAVECDAEVATARDVAVGCVPNLWASRALGGGEVAAEMFGNSSCGFDEEPAPCPRICSDRPNAVLRRGVLMDLAAWWGKGGTYHHWLALYERARGLTDFGQLQAFALVLNFLAFLQAMRDQNASDSRSFLGALMDVAKATVLFDAKLPAVPREAWGADFVWATSRFSIDIYDADLIRTPGKPKLVTMSQYEDAVVDFLRKRGFLDAERTPLLPGRHLAADVLDYEDLGSIRLRGTAIDRVVSKYAVCVARATADQFFDDVTEVIQTLSDGSLLLGSSTSSSHDPTSSSRRSSPAYDDLPVIYSASWVSDLDTVAPPLQPVGNVFFSGHAPTLEAAVERAAALLRPGSRGGRDDMPVGLSADLASRFVGRELYAQLEDSWRAAEGGNQAEAAAAGGVGDLTASLEAFRDAGALAAEMAGTVFGRACGLVAETIDSATGVSDLGTLCIGLGMARTCARQPLLALVADAVRRNNGTVPRSNVLAMAALHLAFVLSYQQRANRATAILERALRHGDDWGDVACEAAVAAVERAVTSGSRRWKVLQHPLWLIFEVEQDVSIWPEQVDVALRMLEPSGGNRVMQLNMGGGKTAVITPIVVAELCARDRNVVPRVMMLASLFPSQTSSLAFRLSGLLGTRLYAFPFRRDVPLDYTMVENIHHQLSQCLGGGHFVASVPSSWQSFELKVLAKKASGNDSRLVAGMEAVRAFYHKHVWNILDESDVILDHKSQLVYTVGRQVEPDGRMRRWSVCAAVLDVVARISAELYRNGDADEGIFFAGGPQGGEDGAWPGLRLVHANDADEVWRALRSQIVTQLLDDPPADLRWLDKCTRAERETLTAAWTDDGLPVHAASLGSALLVESLPDVLVVRGLLCFGILRLALMRRWNVDYGAACSGAASDGTTSALRIAVPFEALGVPKARTEYGHTDVAIALSYLSYYNTGLGEHQFIDAVKHLQSYVDCDLVYQSWTDGLGSAADSLLPREYRTLDGVNLKSRSAITCLHAVFGRQRAVVNFWLGALVFPHEVTEYERKMSSTAWDLCDGEDWVHPVRGFSGTNDNRHMLPIGIEQVDLESLQDTNGKVLRALLDAGNADVFEIGAAALSAPVSALLAAMLDPEHGRPAIRVVIDAGALFVNGTAREVARAWLDRDPDLDGVVFYGSNNQRMVLAVGASNPQRFDSSHLRHRLDRVAIFLDNYHTRGVDFKFPPGTHGAVTIGPDTMKEHLVQAAMRMRGLITGDHTVSLWLPPDVAAAVGQRVASQYPSSTPPSRLVTSHVVAWALHNTVVALEGAILSWTEQGLNHALKHGAARLDETLLQGEMSSVKEHATLAELYGSPRHEHALTLLAQEMRQGLLERFQRAAGAATASPESLATAMAEVGWRSDGVVGRVQAQAGNLAVYAQVLDEEQEREREREAEEESQVERPPRKKPHAPKHDPALTRLLLTGDWDEDAIEIHTADVGLDGSSAHGLAVPFHAWPERLYVTDNYCRVVAGEFGPISGDVFARHPAWLMVDTALEAAILLSPWEANRLMEASRDPERTSREWRVVAWAPRRRDDQAAVAWDPLPVASGMEPWAAPLEVYAAGYCDNSTEVARFLGVIPSTGEAAMSRADAAALIEAGVLTRDWFVLPPSEWPPEAVQDLGPGVVERMRDYRRAGGFVEPVKPLVGALFAVRGVRIETNRTPMGQLAGYF